MLGRCIRNGVGHGWVVAAVWKVPAVVLLFVIVMVLLMKSYTIHIAGGDDVVIWLIFFVFTSCFLSRLSSPHFTRCVSLSSVALKVCICSVGSPFPVHYPTSLHNDPRILPEPVASLRASHCSPVFYLLDNGKKRDVSQISASWTSACDFHLLQ